MPPKQPSDACNSSHSSIGTDDQHQSLYQCSNLSDISVGELLLKYQDNSQLLNNILEAKAEEDRKRTAVEWRQAEEARLQSKYIEYELNQRQTGSSNSSSSNNNNDRTNALNQSFDDFLMRHQQNNSLFEPAYFDQTSNAQSAQFAASDPSASLLPTRMSDYPSIMHHSQEATSIASSSSPTIDLLSPSAFDMYQQNQAMSCSPPDMHDLPLYPYSTATTTTPLAEAPTIPSHPLPANSRSNNDKLKHCTPTPECAATSDNTTTSTVVTPNQSLSTSQSHQPNKTKSGRLANIHRTLSYESVMSLDDLDMNKKSASSPPTPVPPAQPLDHDKVMEALRAKLRRSSSPYQSTRRKPSPEPAPPPNTYPTTGVLLLNLKSRRRKSSVTKRGSCSGKS